MDEICVGIHNENKLTSRSTIFGRARLDISSSIVSYTDKREMRDLEYLRRWPVPRARVQARFLATVDMGCVALASARLFCERSILDCDPPEIENPSEDERGKHLQAFVISSPSALKQVSSKLCRSKRPC